jgi:hypothetical protein
MPKLIRIAKDIERDEIRVPLPSGRTVRVTREPICVHDSDCVGEGQYIEVVGECEDVPENERFPAREHTRTRRSCGGCGSKLKVNGDEYVLATIQNHSETPKILFGRSSGASYRHRVNGEKLKVRCDDVQAEPDKLVVDRSGDTGTGGLQSGEDDK